MLLIIGNNFKLKSEELHQLDTLYEHVVILDRDKYDDSRLVEFIESNKLKIKEIVLNLKKESTVGLTHKLMELTNLEIFTINDFMCKTFELCTITFDEHNYKIIKSIRYSLIGTIFKSIFDRIFSFCVLIFISPIMLFIAYRIKQNSPEGDVLFTQERLGLDGSKFRVLKFRTMVPNAEKVLQDMLDNDKATREEYLKYRKLRVDPRIIPGIGALLRRTSLDELPQFFNVLKGEMSVIGPRPYIENEFINHDNKFQEIILSVKPGVTGFWQVGERSNSTFNGRVEDDVNYITKRTFWLDMKILFQTVMMVVNGDDKAY